MINLEREEQPWYIDQEEWEEEMIVRFSPEEIQERRV